MKIIEDFVNALFNEDVIDNASQMYKSDFNFNGHKDRMAIELFDISFRLFKPTEYYVNLEFLASSQYGHYFKPIGMYDKNQNIYLFNEYIECYQSLKSLNKISRKCIPIAIGINALIAAFSMETISYVINTFEEFNKSGWDPEFKNGIMTPGMIKYDKRYICNGLHCELLFSNEGYPQFFLDDKYEVEGPMGAYIQDNEGKLNIHPIINYKEAFDNLNMLKLLTAFTKI